MAPCSGTKMDNWVALGGNTDFGPQHSSWLHQDRRPKHGSGQQREPRTSAWPQAGTAVTGVKKGCGWWRNMQFPGRVNRVVCSSSLELAQTQPLNKLSSHRTQDGTGFEHGQDIWDEEWFISWIEPRGNISTVHNSPGGHTGISVDCHAAPGGDEAQGPCGYLWSRIILIMCFTLPGGFVIVSSFYLSQSLLDIAYILSLWNIVSKTIALHHSKCKMSSLPFLSLLDLILL